MTAVIVEAAVRSFVLALLVRGGMAVLRVRNPHLEKSVWTAVLLCALAMPALMTWKLPQRIQITSTALPDVSIGAALGGAHVFWLDRALEILYLTVTCALLARLAIGFVRMWHVRRRATRVKDQPWTRGADVRVCATLSAPVTFGSTILLPAGCDSWSACRREAVLAHEREHVRARDCHVQWLAALHLCLFWFSPLSWWLKGSLSRLAEHVSDDAALRVTPDRADYAELLLEAARARAVPSVALSIASRNVSQRIERVLSARGPDNIPAMWRRGLAIALLLPAIALAAGTASVKSAGLRAAEQGGSPGQSAAGPAAAHVVGFGPYGLEHWYPEDAKRKGTEGMVRLAVTLDEQAQPTDVLVLSESPEGAGFGAAAAEMARTFTYANPTGHPTTLVFNAKFALGGHEHYGTTNFESGSESGAEPPHAPPTNPPP